MGSNESKDGPLNNNSFWRGVSDKLDSAAKWGGYDDPNQSSVRATIHAGYHEIQHQLTGNPREHARASDQWCIAKGGNSSTCTNLKTYDAQHAQK